MNRAMYLLIGIAAVAVALVDPLEAEGASSSDAGGVGMFRAHYVEAEDALFEQPDVLGGPWNDFAAHKVILLPQNITTPAKFETSADHLMVRVVHNGSWIAVAASWEDPSRDERTGIGVFPDGLAVGFPRGSVTNTSPFMGGHGAGVEINHWKALWQRDVDVGFLEVTDLHPNLVADAYAGFHADHLPDQNPASSATMQEVMASPDARQSLPAVAIGNPMSQVQREFTVEQAIAEGFGTLSTQQRQDARGGAVYENGRWTVVIARPLDTGDPADVVLAEGAETGINFAVWDGGEEDRGGRKTYSMFTPLLIMAREK